MRYEDGSAGDADYGVIGRAYGHYRQPEPAIMAMIELALGQARTVVNVGAGAGAYEPGARAVTPVEPSASMRDQRPAHLAPAVDAVAENLPFEDDAFDAAMASFTIHQWRDAKAGLRELRRVTRGPVVLLTCDPRKVRSFWLNHYAPEVLAVEARRYPSIETVAAGFATPVEVVPVPIPLHCRDGFNEAYYGRPEMLLDPAARLSCSAWSFVSEETVAASLARLAADLEDGRWDGEFGRLRRQADYFGSLCLMISHGKAG